MNKCNPLVTLLIALLLLLSLSLTACDPVSVGWGIGLGMPILFIFLIIILPILFIGFFIWLIVRKTRQQTTQEQKNSKYLDILKERLAKGEINQEEYEQLKKDLS